MAKLARVVIALIVLGAPSAWAASGASMADAALIKALKAGDAAAAAKCYTDKAVLWVGGAPGAQGAKQIEGFYADILASMTVKDFVLTEMGNESVNDQSVSWGTYALTIVPKKGGTPVTGTGRYTEMAKLVDGKWVYTVDHASEDPMPTPK